MDKDKFYYILSACLLVLFIFQAGTGSAWSVLSFLGTVLALVRGIYESTHGKDK